MSLIEITMWVLIDAKYPVHQFQRFVLTRMHVVAGLATRLPTLFACILRPLEPEGLALLIQARAHVKPGLEVCWVGSCPNPLAITIQPGQIC